jgi:hypothetical protein
MFRLFRNSVRLARGLPNRRRVRPSVEALEGRLVPANFAPTVFSDSGPGSLRAAVIAANTNGQDDVITLAAGTYQLTIQNTGSGQENAAATGDLDLTEAGHRVIIEGQGAAQTTIDGSVTGAPLGDRLFQVLSGVTVELRSLTLQGGQAQDVGTAGAAPGLSASLGGGILNDGTATLQDCVVQNNSAIGGAGPEGTGAMNGGMGFPGDGGGVYNTGTLILLRTTVQANSARGGDGGFASGTGTGGLGALGAGGGIANNQGSVIVTASTISANFVVGGAGGIGAQGGDGNGGSGGALFTLAGQVTFSDSTVAENNVQGGEGGFSFTSSFGGQGGDGVGGGVTSGGAQLAFRNSTIADNRADGGAGGSGQMQGQLGASGSSRGGGVAAIAGGPSSHTSTSSLFANNAADQGPDFFGTFNQADHTLVANPTETSGITDGVNGNLLGVDPIFEALTDNGGPTRTIALLLGSPALDAGANPDGLTTDQRGQPRVSNGQADIGAYEVLVPVATHFRVQAPASVPDGQPFSVTVTALDAGNQAVAGYQGTVHFTSSDAQAGLPADYTFTAADVGAHTFTGALRLQGAGLQTVVVTDTSAPALTGSASVTDVTPPALTGSASVTHVTAPSSPPEFVASVGRKKGKSLVLIADGTGELRWQRAFPFKVQVLRQDVNGDGLLDVILLFRQNGKRRRLLFSGLDLSPLPADRVGH